MKISDIRQVIERTINEVDISKTTVSAGILGCAEYWEDEEGEYDEDEIEDYNRVVDNLNEDYECGSFVFENDPLENILKYTSKQKLSTLSTEEKINNFGEYLFNFADSVSERTGYYGENELELEQKSRFLLDIKENGKLVLSIDEEYEIDANDLCCNIRKM